MKLAVFWGCQILTAQYAYEMSIRQVLQNFDVKLVDLKETACCGDPLKSINNFAAMYLAARVLALMDKTELRDLLVPCNRCHLTLSEAKDILNKDGKLREKICSLLAEEKLEYPSNVKIWHVIDLFHDVVGVDSIREKVKYSLSGLKFACHSGCQIIRPSDIGRVDDSETPQKLDALVEALGAESVDFPEKLDCCGAALLLSNTDAALSLSGSKVRVLQEYGGVNGLVNSCPWCHLMFDAKQKDAEAVIGGKLELPVVYYTQLLGVAMGIKKEKLGLNINRSGVDELFKML